LEETPDVILATGWPVTITIVRGALRRTGLNALLIGYPHMTFREGQEHGVGGIQCIADADAVFAISKQVEAEIEQSGMPVSVFRENDGIQFPAKVIDRDQFPKKRKLLYVGRLVGYKNLPMVFRAIANTKEEWILSVVGQGEDEKTRQTAADCGVLDKIEFQGFSQEPYANTEDISFCVVTSNYEGFCLVIPEALSRGIPIISTPVGCTTEVIKPGENGYLVNVNDDCMLTEILDLIAEEKLPIPSAKACRESVLDFEMNHTFEKMVQDIKTLYAEKSAL
jgi:UDP-D-galactose:(glucosyl)LPS alpha-1,6-D-galactosyltransferase